MALDYDTQKLFEFYEKNPGVKAEMDQMFPGKGYNPDYLPTLDGLYKEHLATERERQAKQNLSPQQKSAPLMRHAPMESHHENYAFLGGLAGLVGVGAAAYIALSFL